MCFYPEDKGWVSLSGGIPATKKGCFETLIGLEGCTYLGIFYTSVCKYIVTYVDRYIFLHMSAYINTLVHMYLCVHTWTGVCVVFAVDSASCFSLTVHQNYIGTDAEKNPFFLSVVLSDQNNQRVPQYHSILWRKTVRNKYLTATLLLLLLLFACLGWIHLSYTFLLSSEFQYFVHVFCFIP